MTTTTSRPTDDRRHTLQRRIKWIVTATIAYNLIEAVVAITAGTVASSAALIGFGPVSYTHLTLPTTPYV